MTNMINWNDLHDATLLGVEMKWASGALQIQLATATGDVTIIGERVVSLVCPRRAPWGERLDQRRSRPGRR